MTRPGETDLASPPEHESSISLGSLVAGGILILLLYLGREIFIPLSLATLFCLLLSPVAGLLERHAHIGRSLSAFLVVTASVAALCVVGWLIGHQAAQLLTEFPKYRDTLVSKVRTTRESVYERVGRATQAFHNLVQETKETRTDAHPEQGSVPPAVQRDAAASRRADGSTEEPVRVEVVPQEPDLLRMATSLVGPVVHPLATLGISAILLVFFLINRKDLRDRIIQLCGSARIPVTTAALNDCSQRVLRFLVAQAFVNSLIGSVIGLGLYMMGVPNAAFWGLLTAVARFLPYIGSITATLLPFLFSFAFFDDWQRPLMVLAWYAIVELLSANILEPLLYGARTGVSPTAILLAFFFWTWLWGPYGLFLATPITVCLVIAGKHISELESLYIMFSDEQVLEPATRFYQRLLAGDSLEAAKVVSKIADESGSLLCALNQVVLPGLAQVEYDRRSQFIDADRLEFALSTAQDLLKEGAGPTSSLSPSGPESGDSLAVVTGGGLFDAYLCRTIRLFAPGLPVHDLTDRQLVSEIVDEIESLKPGTIVFAAVEPVTLRRFRHIYKKMREDGIQGRPLVVVYAASKRAARSASRLARDCGLEQSLSLVGLLSMLGQTTPVECDPHEESASTIPASVARAAG